MGKRLLITLLTILTVNLQADGYFDDLLLIINFNHPHYDNILFLKEIYSPAFPNIVFYGEKKHPGVHQISHHIGYWSQNVLQDAMTRWPNYAGYILCQDDCLMNYWNFLRLDKNKIWFSRIGGGFSLAVPSLDWWSWWNRPFGRQAAMKAVKKLPNPYRQNLEHNLGPNAVGIAWADFVYIPGRLREDYLIVVKRFLDPPVFLEIAFPTILCALESKEQWNILNPFWGIQTLDQYDTKFDWVHPIKFSSFDNREFVRNVMINK